MTQIFISYRREESAGEAGRLADRLIQKYGSEKLFMDIDSIDPGTDFVVKLQEALQSCEIVLAFIGRNWLNITDKRGRRRIEDPDDFVHIELASALARRIPVIPVLVQGATVPEDSELPEKLKNIAKRQAIDIRHEHFHRDVELVINEIDRILIKAEPRVKPGKTLNPRDYFDVVLPTMLRWKGKAATKPNCTILWEVIGLDGGNWFIVLKPPNARVQKGAFEDPDVTIKITEKAMQEVLSGRFNPKEAIANGEIELSGELSLLKKVGFLFQAPKEVKPSK